MEENREKSIVNKVVVVTGSSRGIGAEIVRTLANENYKVILNYNNSKEQAEKIQQELLEQGKEIEIIKADVSKKEEAEKYARVLETEMLLRKYADEHNEDMPWDGICEHYFLYFNNDAIHISYFSCSKEARKIYFSSREIAGAAIEEIGKERIEEYLTYEW